MARTLEMNADFDTLDAPPMNPLENPERVNAASAAAMASAVGAAPKIDTPQDTSVTLQQGIFRGDKWHRDAEVRELTGEDEEAIARIRSQWARVLDTLVSRGTVHVGSVPMSRDVSDELLIGDRDELLIAIRIATFGEWLEIEDYPCPECGERTDFSINLRRLPHVPLIAPGEGLSVVLRSGSVARLRYPTGADQRAIYTDSDNTNPAAQNTLLLSRCLLSVDETPVPLSPAGRMQNVKKLGMSDRRLILKEMFDNQPGPRLDRIECTHDACGAVIKLPLALGDMFLGL